MAPRVLDILTELRGVLEKLYGDRLSQLVLFGSQARGEADPDSDIDVLVVLRGPTRPGEEIARTGGVVSDLCLAHRVVIACVFMDQDRFLNRQDPLLRNVRREGIPI